MPSPRSRTKMCLSLGQLAVAFVILFTFVDSSPNPVSVLQCDTYYFDMACLSGISLKTLIHEEQMDNGRFHDEIICSCAHKARNNNHKFFAQVKPDSENKITCYSVDITQALLTSNKVDGCPKYCDILGCVRLGTGTDAMIIEVPSNSITLPTEAPTTIKTIILQTTTTKPIVFPPLPDFEDM